MIIYHLHHFNLYLNWGFTFLNSFLRWSLVLLGSAIKEDVKVELRYKNQALSEDEKAKLNLGLSIESNVENLKLRNLESGLL